MITSLNTKGKILQILVAFVLSVGLIFPTGTVVLAEDTVPPTTQEETAPAEPAAPSDPVAPADPVVPVEGPVVEASVEPPAGEVPADPTIEAPVVDPTSDPVVTAEPVIVEEQVEPAPVAEEVAEEIIQAADENNVTLADANGEPLTLATEETAELLSTGDPFYWSNTNNRWEGYTVSGSGCPANVYCMSNANPFQAAVNAAPTGSTIYVAAGSYAEELIINKADLTFIGFTSLTANRSGSSHWISNLNTGTATVNKITLNVNFVDTQNVTSSNIFINSGATLVDALELLSQTGGVIELGAGTFDDDKNVNVNKSAEIKGQGSGLTTLLAATDGCSGNNCPDYLNINASNVKIHDLKLDGKNDGDGASLDADVAISYTNNFDGLEVYNTIIQNFYSRGILIGEDSCGGGSCDNNTYNIHNNTIQNIRGASGGGGSSTDGIGIQISNDTGSSNRTISGNIITNTDIGIDFSDSQLNITGNTLNDNSYGIRGEDSSANITYNNIFSNATGIYIVDLDEGNDLNINLNRLKGNTSYGLNYEDVGGSDPYIDAERNWWGCNTGARIAGGSSNCDRITTTRTTYSPWLMLGLSANPTSIYTSETSTLTPFMYLSNDNTNKTPVAGLTWFSLPAVLQTGTSFGSMAGYIFTAGGSAGTQNFSTTYDNATATTTVTITVPTIVGCMDPLYKEYNPAANTSDPSMCKTLIVVGCMDSGYIEFNPAANTSDPSMCVTPVVLGCMDDGYTEYNPLANKDDGTCETPVVLGCMDDGYTEYNPLANTDDGTCETPVVLGCMDDGYTEYNPLANTDDGTCETPVVLGCMDDGYTEYNPLANTDDGTCETPVVLGCMDDGYIEYNPLANTDDGTCETPVVVGCMVPSAANYNPLANVAGVCTAKPPITPYSPPFVFGVGGLFDPGIIPITGGLNALSCDVANTLALPNGDKVVFSDILCDFEAALTQEFSETLLSPLPTGLTFVDGFNLEVQKNATLFNVLPQPVTNTLSFVVPDAFKGKTLKILFWDASKKNGMGDWVEIPSKLMANGEVVSAPLTDGDQRLVVSGVELTSLPTTETTLNFTGLFILAAE